MCLADTISCAIKPLPSEIPCVGLVAKDPNKYVNTCCSNFLFLSGYGGIDPFSIRECGKDRSLLYQGT